MDTVLLQGAAEENAHYLLFPDCRSFVAPEATEILQFIEHGVF